jgi:ADP-heptose:LPS heptosyltransferase
MTREAAITGLSRTLRWLFRNARGSSLTQDLHPKRVLILKPCCLGDVLLSTPLIAALRHTWPDAEISYAVGAWSRPMVEHNPHIDRILTVPDRWTLGSMIVVARELRRRQYDIVFVPERTPLPGLVAWLAGIPARVGLDSQGRGFTYTTPVSVPETLMHEAELYLLLAEAVGARAAERRLWFLTSDSDRAEAAHVLGDVEGDGPIVVVHPGGGKNPGMVLHRKRWLPERWAIVADAIHDRYGARILIVGSADEVDVAGEMRQAMRRPATILARQWRWGVLAAVIEQSRLFLGHDTGMSLLANALGTRHIVVFGPSDPQIYGPFGANGRALWRPTRESPCFYRGTVPENCPCAGQCMHNLEPADVLDLVHRMLAS